MHRLSRMGLALVGMSLAAPTASWAGDPHALAYGASHGTQSELEFTHRPRHLCPRCQERLRQGDPTVAAIPEQIPAMPGATVDGGCVTCQQAPGSSPMLVGDGSGYPVVSQPTLGATTHSGYSAPGYAVVGGPWAGSPMITGGQPYDPAMAGEMILSAEPAPIGVVQTGFRTAPGMPAAPAPSFMGPAPTPRGPAPMMPGVLPGQRRPHVLAHLLGLSGRNRWSEARQAQQRADHAAISYGPHGQAPSQLPSWMVYGR